LAGGILSAVMQVRVIPFGVLKDWLGASPAAIELGEGASVGDLLERLGGGAAAPRLRGIAVSVNAEYATTAQILHEGDEVGLLPPVSGGAVRTASGASRGDGAARTASGASRGDAEGAAGSTSRSTSRTADSLDQSEDERAAVVALTREPIDAEKLVAAAKGGEDGAVVVFDGIVRNNSRGRQTLHLDYEAYEEMAARQMEALAAEALARFGVRRVTMIHRLGRLEVGETSVLIVVASAHRAQAFDACRWLIDTLKQTVPIWKKETFADGAVWAGGEPFPEGIAVDGAEAEHDA
jgi:molybdopterin synthase catalytic subunit